MNRLVKFLFILSAALFFSCTTQKVILPEISETEEKDAPQNQAKTSSIKLCFGGDIMAHKPNFSMTDYSKIWKNVKPVISQADFAFANIETTIDDSKEDESYPKFSVNSRYAQEAVNAGFNVFSLINNHTNDHGYEGIQATAKWSREISAKYEQSSRPVYFSGLREKGQPYSYCIIEKNGWKILFAAVTELLNQYNNLPFLNYSEPNTKGRAALIAYLKKLREENECDLFIFSLHTAEKEYVLETSQTQNSFYLDLLNKADVDVVWANHPHVVKNWSVVQNSVDGKNEKLIMRANGNTISGQRWDPQFNAPETIRDYTGDGLLLNVTFEKKVYTDAEGSSVSSKPEISEIKPMLITTYIDSSWQFILQPLDDNFIHELEKKKRTVWAEYLKKRKALMEKIEGNTICQ